MLPSSLTLFILAPARIASTSRRRGELRGGGRRRHSRRSLRPSSAWATSAEGRMLQLSDMTRDYKEIYPRYRKERNCGPRERAIYEFELVKNDFKCRLHKRSQVKIFPRESNFSVSCKLEDTRFKLQKHTVGRRLPFLPSRL